MKPQVLLAVLAILAVLAALPLGHGIGDRPEDGNASDWPCCDTCSVCTRSLPPKCRCADMAPDGCHPACKKCVRSSVGGSILFRCADSITDFCKRRCTPAA